MSAEAHEDVHGYMGTNEAYDDCLMKRGGIIPSFGPVAALLAVALAMVVKKRHW